MGNGTPRGCIPSSVNVRNRLASNEVRNPVVIMSIVRRLSSDTGLQFTPHCGEMVSAANPVRPCSLKGRDPTCVVYVLYRRCSLALRWSLKAKIVPTGYNHGTMVSSHVEARRPFWFASCKTPLHTYVGTIHSETAYRPFGSSVDSPETVRKCFQISTVRPHNTGSDSCSRHPSCLTVERMSDRDGLPWKGLPSLRSESPQ